MAEIKGSTILVTGGAGFVGSYVVEQLLQESVGRVLILDNLIRGSHRNMESFADDKRVEFTEGDIRDTPLLESLVEQADYIYHMAALRINACAADPVAGFDTMCMATFNLVHAAHKAGVKKIIYSSSASVYGMAQHFPTPETDNPYDNQTFYGAAKMWGEGLLRSYKHMFGLDYVALRYFNVYGPRMDTDGRYTEVMIKWLDCIKEGRPPLIYGDGTTSMDFVYVTDIAQSNIKALKADVTDEVFNVGVCEETNLKQMLDALLAANDSDLKPEYVADNTVNPVPRRLADISKAENMLGYQPTVTLQEGLKKLSAWYYKIKEEQGVI